MANETTTIATAAINVTKKKEKHCADCAFFRPTNRALGRGYCTAPHRPRKEGTAIYTPEILVRDYFKCGMPQNFKRIK